MPSRKERKAYPDRAERISMAEKKIARLEELNASRRALIEQTEAKLEDRKKALARTEAQLAREVQKRDRLVELQSNPIAVSRAIKTSKERAEVAEIMRLLREKGLSIDDLKAKVDE